MAKTTAQTLKLCESLDHYIHHSPKRPPTLYIAPHQMEILHQEKERGTLPLYINLGEDSFYRDIKLEVTT